MGLLTRIFALDLRSVALVRMGIACLILIDLVDRARFLREHYTDDGVFPRAALVATQGRVQWSLHLMSGSVNGQAVLFIIAGLFALALLVGWHTQVFAVASWVMLVSLQNRTPAVCYGADALLRSLLFFALFLPLGARFSRDVIDGRVRARPDDHRSIPAVAIAVQIALIYIFTGILKLDDVTWQHLNAVYFAVNADHHATHLGLWMGQSLLLTRVLSFGTLMIELLGPLLLLVSPSAFGGKGAHVRVAMIAAFFVFHTGTALSLHLGYFPWVSVLAWLLFIPTRVWERLGSVTAPGVDVDRHALAAGVSAVVVMLVFVSNLASAMPSVELPPLADRIARALSMEQRWIMFIHPMHDGWFLAPATLASGTTIDVLNDGAPVSFEKPAFVADQFPSMRWRKYITDLQWERPVNKKSRALFAKNICDQWNTGLTDDDARMLSVDIVFMQQDDRTDGTQTPVQRRVLAHRDCGARDVDDSTDAAPFFEQKPSP